MSQSVSESSGSGVGIDCVEIERLARVLERTPAFIDKYFADVERTWCEAGRDRVCRYAVCLAAKEAFLKALGEGVLGRIPMREVELHDRRGRAFLALGPAARRALEAKDRRRTLVSVTEDGRYAHAIVVLA